MFAGNPIPDEGQRWLVQPMRHQSRDSRLANNIIYYLLKDQWHKIYYKYNHTIGCWHNKAKIILMENRAVQATTLSSQRGHVFRPQNWGLLAYCIMSLFVVNTLFRLRDLNIFRILFTEALLRCRVVALSHWNCREAKKLWRAQLCWIITHL